jgi:hypothetical protein
VGQCIVKTIRSVRTDRPLDRRVEADVVVSTWPGDLPLLPLPVENSSSANRSPELDQTFEAHKEDVTSCFLSARRQDSKLWGRLAISFIVGEDGKLENLREADSNFGSTTAVSCVIRRLTELRFDVQRSPTRFVIGFRLKPPDDILLDTAYTTIRTENGKTFTAFPLSEKPPPRPH